MSEQIIAAVSRDNAIIFTNIPMEIFFETFMEQHVGGGMRPFYRYLCIVWQLIDIRQNDYIMNAKRIDPLTGQLISWLDNAGAPNNLQIVTKPERFAGGHIEFRADDQRTTGFV